MKKYKLARVEQWGDTIASPGMLTIVEDSDGPYYLATDVDARLAELDAACKALARERETLSGSDSNQPGAFERWMEAKRLRDANPTAARYLAQAREETK